MSEPADDDSARSEAARMMGRSRSPRKVETARANAAKAAAARTGKPMSQEQKDKIGATMKARWQEKAAAKQDNDPGATTSAAE